MEHKKISFFRENIRMHIDYLVVHVIFLLKFSSNKIYVLFGEIKEPMHLRAE
jgi:hypothetical protein